MKKAEMGIGTLIIFIAMILVAAIAAGVILQTASSLQNKALLTGEKSKVQVSTGFITLQIYAEDGRSGQVAAFCQTMKLQPGSEPMKFEDALLNFDTKDASSDKIYGNRTTAVINTTQEQPSGIDFDGDGTIDNMILNSSCNGLIIELTNHSNPVNYTIDLDVSLYGANSTNKKNITVLDAPVNLSNRQVGALSIVAYDVAQNCTLDGSQAYIIGAGNEATSAYSVEYLVQGSSHVSGYLVRGDVVRICYTAPRVINEDEDIAISFIPKVGTISIINTALPEIVSQERVYVYP